MTAQFNRPIDSYAFTAQKALTLSPIVGALIYPFLLIIFHNSVNKTNADLYGAPFIAVTALFVVFAIPLYAFWIAFRLGSIDNPSRFEVRARRLAFASTAAPPLFVLDGVASGILNSPISDLALWMGVCLCVALYGALANDDPAPKTQSSVSRLRVVHGITAIVIVIFVAFHLSNHLTGLFGQELHKIVMEAGREIYRHRLIEPLLIGFLLFQIGTGGRLVWHWTNSAADFYRTIQIGSGIYIGAFILTHLNSALISARMLRNKPTDWAWASGAPDGLIYDAWNIRLLPHYGFAVFFVLVHLCTALRFILIAHGVARTRADQLWRLGSCASGAIALAICLALVGVRI